MAKEEKYGAIDIKGIPEDEPVFVLRAQDVFAPVILKHYADLRDCASAGGGNRIRVIREHFIDWPKKKIPD
jgi:hypothetical protein